jgi:hypothetical protein
VAADFLDRVQIGPGIGLIAADGARQQHAQQAGVVQLCQQRLGDVLGPFYLVRRGRDGGTQVPCP